jgi:hypothetical protein
MGSKKLWINISILNLCIVALLGVLMRSKMIFDMPWIDYNRLVDTHGHFAFSGWVTLALITLMIYELPGNLYQKKIYGYLLWAIVLCSWITLVTGPFEHLKFIADAISMLYIVVTYVLAWVFIRDILKSYAGRAVKLLSVSAMLSLVLSSGGALMLAYLFSVKSLNAVLYRDALFGYLHLNYNGFFTLAVFALIFNKVVPHASAKANKSIFIFSWLLCLSVLPSMFLTFLWHKVSLGLRIVPGIGSALLILTFVWFIICCAELVKEFKLVKPSIRFVVVLALAAFAIKISMQSLTFFDTINVLVFGNRPMIMGFLHLVFLGFVTLFLIAYFVQKGILVSKSVLTEIAVIVFTIAVLINETLLMLQGLGSMFIVSSPLFSWYLWGAGLLLLAGSLLIAMARIRTRE